MTSTEFTTIFIEKYLAGMLPDTYGWFRGLPDETKLFWFDTLAGQELEDCRHAVESIARDGLKAYDRELLPSRILKLAADYRHNRNASLERARQRKHQKPLGIAGIMQTIGCAAAFRKLTAKQLELQATVGKFEGQARQAFIDELFEGEPETDDPQAGPRFKCLACHDTGFQSKPNKPNTAYCCDCETGKKQHNNFNARHRFVGCVVNPARRTEFDDWNER